MQELVFTFLRWTATSAKSGLVLDLTEFMDSAPTTVPTPGFNCDSSAGTHVFQEELLSAELQDSICVEIHLLEICMTTHVKNYKMIHLKSED